MAFIKLAFKKAGTLENHYTLVQSELLKAIQKAEKSIESKPLLFRRNIWVERKQQISLTKRALSESWCDYDLIKIIKKQYMTGTRGFVWSSYDQYLDDLGNILVGISNCTLSKDSADCYNGILKSKEERLNKDHFYYNQVTVLRHKKDKLQKELFVLKETNEKLKSELAENKNKLGEMHLKYVHDLNHYFYELVESDTKEQQSIKNQKDYFKGEIKIMKNKIYEQKKINSSLSKKYTELIDESESFDELSNYKL